MAGVILSALASTGQADAPHQWPVPRIGTDGRKRGIPDI